MASIHIIDFKKGMKNAWIHLNGSEEKAESGNRFSTPTQSALNLLFFVAFDFVRISHYLNLIKKKTYRTFFPYVVHWGFSMHIYCFRSDRASNQMEYQEKCFEKNDSTASVAIEKKKRNQKQNDIEYCMTE